MLHPASIPTSIAARTRAERHTTQDFAESSGPHGHERFELGDGWILVAQHVRHRHELVRIGALIAITADRGRDPPNRDGAIAVHPPRDVAQTVGERRPGESRCLVHACRVALVTRESIRLTEAEAGL